MMTDIIRLSLDYGDDFATFVRLLRYEIRGTVKTYVDKLNFDAIKLVKVKFAHIVTKVSINNL